MSRQSLYSDPDHRASGLSICWDFVPLLTVHCIFIMCFSVYSCQRSGEIFLLVKKSPFTEVFPGVVEFKGNRTLCLKLGLGEPYIFLLLWSPHHIMYQTHQLHSYPIYFLNNFYKDFYICALEIIWLYITHLIYDWL